ncbi:ankyrin repeat domain-containing protein [Candidatus Dependentiae bacterium]|nr:ankyrin repeat domain-containing protein [Candidatus Dependentiae bacterium]
MFKNFYLLFFVFLSNLFAMDFTKELMQSAKNGNIEKIQKILMSGFDINTRDPNNRHTALIWAARKGYKDIVELLLNEGADINATTNLGMTALAWAKIYEQKEIVEFLRNRGAIE